MPTNKNYFQKPFAPLYPISLFLTKTIAPSTDLGGGGEI